MVSRRDGIGRDMRAGRRVELTTDLMAIARLCDSVALRLENLRRSLSFTPIMSHDLMCRLLLGTMESALLTLSTCMRAWLELEGVEVDLSPDL